MSVTVPDVVNERSDRRSLALAKKRLSPRRSMRDEDRRANTASDRRTYVLARRSLRKSFSAFLISSSFSFSFDDPLSSAPFPVVEAVRAVLDVGETIIRDPDFVFWKELVAPSSRDNASASK